MLFRVADGWGWQPEHIGIWSRDLLAWIAPSRKLVIRTNGSTRGIVRDRAGLRGSTALQMIVVTLRPGRRAIAT